METTLRKPVPFGVYVVVAFYLFGAFALIIGTLGGLVDARIPIARAHGLPGLAGTGFVFLVVVLALVMGYGLISRSRWGYLLTMVYALYIIVISLVLGALNFPLRGDEEAKIYFGNLLWASLVALYLFLVRRRLLHRA